MGGTPNNSGDTFDVRRIRRLIELMDEFDLKEVDLKQADQRIRLRRGADPTAVVAASAATPPPHAQPPVAPASAQPAPVVAAKPEEAQGDVIRSPMVGTFYSAANPESPPFVKVGDHVGADTTVCIIEAMKVFNEIPAECSGKIVAVLAENGDAVEFGQPLFRIESAG